MDAAKYGNLAGATDIVIHPGSYFGQPPDAVLKIALPRLQVCRAELRLEGNPVILRVETMGKSALMGSLDDVIRLAEKTEGVLPCIDFAHLHSRSGTGAVNSYEEWMEIFERLKSALGKSALQQLHIHVSGIEYGLKGERKHLPFAQADLDYRQLLKALADSGGRGRIMCESPILEEDAILLRDYFRTISSAHPAG
jgi:deoxyribonuclease-4